ncbi:PAS/PAC sensor signal transduction histidine kinase [Marinobacterium mangrovicola]|uniref:Phosphate regulon sensor protein PhoR n=1 Tax=Marinobacterium mangrovicola TaxID=1476959 RepID=A0A4R1GA48_9GAMM|nr:phosphate regulon sensor histidine kinase PhoR [Marinobacterium mangrovicola]TCK03510.1 PAS/PAC sensor signal transduction histidine kinase [Marinobacterium mangrovicola]
MRHSSNPMILPLAGVALVGVVIGSLVSYPGWGLGISLLAWSLLEARHYNRLMKWLSKEEDDAPPEDTGPWGDLLDQLARRHKRGLAREQRLQSVISRFQQCTAALSDAIVIIDRENHLEWWNRAAGKLLGIDDRDRGKSIFNIIRDPRFIRYYRKGLYQESLQLVSPSNHDMHLQYQINRFGDDDRVLVARDVTRLVKLEQTRQDFVANASHELRTPLTVISGYLETFLDQEMPRPLQRGMSQMQQQAKRMESLVADLLLLSRLEATQHASDEQPIRIQSLISQIHHDAVDLSGEREHSFQLEVDPDYDLSGQELELQSAFSNLVFNAVRYTPEAGNIEISWRVDAKGGHFSVKDNGIGIDPIHIPRLTERFYRVDESRSSASGGTGLGLAIVKHVLMRHGAQLTIESKSGKGSLFSCHFPPDMIRSIKQVANDLP